MRSEEPAAILQRLRSRPDPGAHSDDPEDDDGEAELPSWVPDGLPSRRSDWLAAVRADPGRAGGIALGAVAALAVAVTVFTMIRSHPEPVASAKLPPVEMVSSAIPTTAPGSPGGAGPVSSTESAHPVVVSVVGLVRQPGLVTVAPDARIADAVAAAGGTLPGADTLGLNLARHVEDGEQIVVGITMPAGRPPALGSSARTGKAPPSSQTAGAKPVGPLDLNTATIDQFDGLPGVGPVTAAAIVAWRTVNGRFSTVDQLGEVDGIGPARLDKLRPLVRV